MSKAPFLSRAAFARITTPAARAMLRLGLTPDAVTILGAVVSVTAALTLFPTGRLFVGTLVIWFFVTFDMLDGAMARERGGGTRFGAVLDATCDRVSDGAVFGGLLWWAAFGLHDRLLVAATAICLVTSQVISYIKARAEARAKVWVIRYRSWSTYRKRTPTSCSPFWVRSSAILASWWCWPCN